VITVCCTSLTVVVALWRLESKHFGLDKAGTLTTYLPIIFQTLRYNKTVDGGHRLYKGVLYSQNVVPFHSRPVNYFLTSERRLPCPDFHQTRNFSTAFCPHFVPNFIQIDQEIWKVRVEIQVPYAFKYSVPVPLSWFSQNTGLFQHSVLKSCCVEVHGYPTNGLVADAGPELSGRSTDRQTWPPSKPLLPLKEHPVIKRKTGASLAAERKCVEKVERNLIRVAGSCGL